ncbi:MAG: hypothetical protein P8Z30_02855 [Acidobacteriota bacterium]
MSGKVVSDVFSYLGYTLEVCLFVYLVARGHARRLWEIVLYLAMSLGVAGARSYTLHLYGFSSIKYYYSYWITDFLLVFTAFTVVVFLFRRACAQHPEMWRHLRLLLGVVFFVVTVISLLSLSNSKEQIYSLFIIQFSQNLYFACLVLNTLLYLLVLKTEIADDRLGLLVCGLGIEFAGPAAGLALIYLTRGAEIGRLVGVYLVPLCDIGMILTWFYAVSRTSEATKAPQSKVRASRILAEESATNF